MVTTHYCARGKHDDCTGQAVGLAPVGDSGRYALVSVLDCGCLCHAGSATDDALERLLEREGRQQ